MKQWYEVVKYGTSETQGRFIYTVHIGNEGSLIASRKAILETPHTIPPKGDYVWGQYEQATSTIYKYIEAMRKGGMMRPSARHGRALILGLGTGALNKAVSPYHWERPLNVDNSLGMVQQAFDHFGFDGEHVIADAYAFMTDPYLRLPSFGTIYLDIFAMQNGELSIPDDFLTEEFAFYVWRRLQATNAMFVANLGDSAIGSPQHKQVREFMQYCGTRFDRTYITKVEDREVNCANLVMACLKDDSHDIEHIDFFHPEGYNESEKTNHRAPTLFDRKIKFQRFHALGKVWDYHSESPIEGFVEQPQKAPEDITAVHDTEGFDAELWSKFPTHRHLSLTHDVNHMRKLYDAAIEAGEYKTLHMRTLSDADGLVGLIPYYVDKACATPDGQVVYTNSMLGEDIIINYEPLVLPQHFLNYLRLMPPYISTDISFPYSERVFNSLKRNNENPLEVLADHGVCLFEYETTKVRPLSQLYDLMDRDTRKEAQRLMRNAEGRFNITVGRGFPLYDESWDALLKNYMGYRAELDSELEGSEGYVSSVVGTQEHLMACESAANEGTLITIEFRDKEQDMALVAVNFAILHEAAETVSDVVCIRNCDEEYKRFGLGVVAILKNFEAVNDYVGIKWYDLGNMGTENNYKYKRMFFTDVCFRFGAAKASPCMLIEATMKDSGYIFPMLAVAQEGYNHSIELVKNRQDAEDLFLRLSLDEILDVQEYYNSLTIWSQLRDNIRARLEAIVYAKENPIVPTPRDAETSSSADSTTAATT